MALVIKITLPGRSLPEARENLERLREVFIKAAGGKADMFAVLAWELEAKAAEMRTRALIRKRRRA